MSDTPREAKLYALYTDDDKDDPGPRWPTTPELLAWCEAEVAEAVIEALKNDAFAGPYVKLAERNAASAERTRIAKVFADNPYLAYPGHEIAEIIRALEEGKPL